MVLTRDDHVVHAATRDTAGVLAAGWSLLAAAAGAWFLVDPAAYPLRTSDGWGSVLTAAVPVPVVAALLVVLGAVGVLTAAVMRRRPVSPSVRRLVLAAGIAETVVFGLVIPDLRVLAFMGYTCALLGPIAVLGILIAGVRRNPRILVVLAALLLGGGACWWLFGGDARVGARFLHDLAGGLARSGPGILVVGLAFCGGTAWAVATARFHRLATRRCLACGRPAARWASAASAARWGRWVTIAAALGPLPYGLTRMTWFTPWPILATQDQLAAMPAVRVFGLCLGLSAIGGSVLTLGLISRWGEVFPRWVPVLRDRPVPVVPPTVAALVVAGAVTVAGRSFLEGLVVGSSGVGLGLAELLLFPFPIWGPLLGAAAIAYYLRRRGACSACGLADG